MSYQQAVNTLLQEQGVERSSMMGSECLRYQGDFMAMMFEKEDSLIVKVSPERVNELVGQGLGNEFNYTGKRFKEWVLIPVDYQDDYEAYIYEALAYARNKCKK